MKNLDKLKYTYKHRKIVIFLAKKYSNSKRLLEQLERHDLDKMYLLLLYDKDSLKDVHRNISSHHDNDIPKTELDYMEMVLDWESARYTKPDKPLNAYDTLYKYYPHLENEILPILKKFKIDYSTLEKDKDVVEYTKSLKDITEEDIRKELIDYIKTV